MANTKWTGLLEVDDAFLEAIYRIVATIPAGRVCTYGKVAELAGYPGAAREAGIAMSRVPAGVDLPCHRVVSKQGGLAPSYAFGGKERQRALLEAEGVAFQPDARIDMEKHQWPDPPEGAQVTFFE